jgi:tetratricopeptide (TPR) repeat protein
MRRLIAVLILLASTFMSATPAEAFWGRHCGWGRCGWGGCGYGYRGYGWGGYYGGYRSYYRGWGYGYPGWGYGGWGYSGYGNPYYAMGSYPTYNTYSMYSPYYAGANYGTSNVGVPASVNNPLYGTVNRAPTTSFVSSPSSFTAPVFATKPTAPPAAAATPRPAVVPAAITPVGAAVQKFLGIGELRPVAPLGARAATSARPVAPIVDSIVARFSNTDSRRKAEKLIAEADEFFKAQNFHSALQKYKLAASTAPDVPEAFWREGHALVATHNYELAATAFKRAIALTEDLSRGGFRLSDIYGGAKMTKQQHLESLAEWAATKRNSSDPYFLIGLFLEYDGQLARAEKFFQKANELAGISGGHIAVFLDPVAPSLLKSVERTAAKPAGALPVVTISMAREI